MDHVDDKMHVELIVPLPHFCDDQMICSPVRGRPQGSIWPFFFLNLLITGLK